DMALTTQIQTAFLFLLLLSNFVCPSVLPRKVRAHGRLAPGGEWDWRPLLQRTKRFDSHFPICSYCCNCCRNAKCGFCCRV
uniref:Hepcidin n=1 Tax=Vombatus ursinus TaxID=29139 RepID=A0A4X2MAB7_VOMUR